MCASGSLHLWQPVADFGQNRKLAAAAQSDAALRQCGSVAKVLTPLRWQVPRTPESTMHLERLL